MVSETELISDFVEMRPRIVRFLLARTGSQADAEEIAQEVWLKLDGRTADSITNPAAYIFRTAENCLRDRLRARQRRLDREGNWSDVHFGNNEADYHADPERVLISREELLRIQESIAALPERTAYIFRAFRLEGRKQRDLAEELQISLSAVEKHLQRAYAAVIKARRKASEEKE